MAEPLPSAFSEALDAALEDYRARQLAAVDDALVAQITAALLKAMSKGVHDREVLKQIAMQAAAE